MAEVRFTRADASTSTIWTHTVVEVDFTFGPHGSGCDLLEEINDCIRAHHIRVRDRSALERSRPRPPSSLSQQAVSREP